MPHKKSPRETFPRISLSAERIARWHVRRPCSRDSNADNFCRWTLAFYPGGCSMTGKLKGMLPIQGPFRPTGKASIPGKTPILATHPSRTRRYIPRLLFVQTKLADNESHACGGWVHCPPPILIRLTVSAIITTKHPITTIPIPYAIHGKGPDKMLSPITTSSPYPLFTCTPNLSPNGSKPTSAAHQIPKAILRS